MQWVHIIALLATLSASVSAHTYTLLHRSLPGTRWSTRAEFDLVGEAAPVYKDLLSPGDLAKALGDSADAATPSGGFYQLLLFNGTSGRGAKAYEKAETLPGAVLTSVRKCHLLNVGSLLSDTLTLHLAPQDPASPTVPRPYAIEYDITGLTLGSDGCPKDISPTWRLPDSAATTLEVRVGTPLPDPTLRAPVPIKEDGTPQEPPKEKSLIQKYWMYAVPLLILMAIPGDAPESAEGDKTSKQEPNPDQRARRLK